MRRLALALLLAGLALAQEEEGAVGEEEATEDGLGALAGERWKAKPIDFKKVDRTIGKLPALNSPLFGLFLFGPEGKTRVWAVIGRSARDNEAYDVLYLDRNADGDLTGKDERIAGVPMPDDGKTMPGVDFRIGDFREPRTDVVHTEFEIYWQPPFAGYRIKWSSGAMVGGDCGFGSSPAEAPVFVPGTDRPFEFAPWGRKLERGRENDVMVQIGNRGDRDDAFSWVDERFLPEGEKVLVQLVCKDSSGVERKVNAELKERLRVGIFHGPLKVPKDAATGPATLRVRLPDSSAYESFPSELAVTIE
jgi:hypothetical protein